MLIIFDITESCLSVKYISFGSSIKLFNEAENILSKLKFSTFESTINFGTLGSLIPLSISPKNSVIHLFFRLTQIV